MENEIKVNEYVRTKRGIIDKVVKITDDYILLKSKIIITEYGECCTFIKKTDIAKHSFELTDLVGKGDYINGILVTGKESTLLWTEIKGIDRSEYHIPISQYGENIKSVVTKEMMKSIEYRVNRDMETN